MHIIQKSYFARAKFGLLGALAMGFFATISAPASASAIWNGTNVTVEWLYPNTSSVYGGPVSVIANPGVSISNFATSPNDNETFNINFTDTGVVITDARNGAPFTSTTFNGLVFIDSSVDFTTAPPVLTAANWNTFGASDVTYDAQDIYLNFQGQPLSTDYSLTLDVNSAAVPEPSTLSLFGAALLSFAGFAVYRRRKQATTNPGA